MQGVYQYLDEIWASKIPVLPCIFLNKLLNLPICSAPIQQESDAEGIFQLFILNVKWINTCSIAK